MRHLPTFALLSLAAALMAPLSPARDSLNPDARWVKSSYSEPSRRNPLLPPRMLRCAGEFRSSRDSLYSTLLLPEGVRYGSPDP